MLDVSLRARLHPCIHFAGKKRCVPRLFDTTHPKRTVDYQFIMDKQSSFETFELQELYQMAMREGLPLERFDKFGTVQLGGGQYEYDLEFTPFVADAKRLFGLLYHPRPVSDHFITPWFSP